MIEPVRLIAIEDIEQARERVKGTVLRTPLVRVDDRIWLKIAEKSRTIEGAAALAAELTGEAGEGPIVCVVSGGNVDLETFSDLVGS
jgi:threonine dehydratase